MSSRTILRGGLSGSRALEQLPVGWPPPPPLVSSFAPPDARTCSFQPRRFPSATLPAGRGLDGEQVASGPGAVPVTPAAGECLNKDCQCENVREEGGGRGEEGVHLSSGLCIGPELVTAPWLTAGGASVSSLRGPVFTA